MVQQQAAQEPRQPQAQGIRGRFPYDDWMESTGLPIYRGHFVANPVTLELANWPERGVNAAFIQLMGMQGVCEARITEIPPGQSSEPFKMAVGEVVYVLDGQVSGPSGATARGRPSNGRSTVCSCCLGTAGTSSATREATDPPGS